MAVVPGKWTHAQEVPLKEGPAVAAFILPDYQVGVLAGCSLWQLPCSSASLAAPASLATVVLLARANAGAQAVFVCGLFSVAR